MSDKGVTITKADSHVDASDIGAVKSLHQIIAKPERTVQGNIRVSKPGDINYVPQCETTRAFVEGRPKTTRFPTHKRGVEDIMDADQELASSDREITRLMAGIKPKRGKDIKCFGDLPPDVQATINRVSESNEEKAKRTAAAIKYQHLFPERYHSIGMRAGP